MRRLPAIALGVVVVLASASLPVGAAAGPGPRAPVPDEYRPLANELDAAMAAFRADLSGKRPKDARPPVISAELLTANGNQGPTLLDPTALDRNRFLLDALEQLGARGVAVDIPYPLLAPTFPRHDEYLAFYKAVADDVRGRGMKLLIETQVVFTGTPYSPLDIDYSAMPLDEFLAGRTAQTVLIAHELRPDYLAFTTEQATDAMLTRQPVTTDRYVQFVDDTVAAVGDAPGVRLGAGSGSWESEEFVRRIATRTTLDFVDIHVYPLAVPGRNLLEVARHMARIARANGKQVVIGEAWLYKASKAELAGGLDFTSALPRDSLSFWAPYDADFVRTIGALARSEGVSLVIFYWAQYLFAYPEPAATSATDGRAALQASNAAAAAAILAGERTRVGRAFRRQA